MPLPGFASLCLCLTLHPYASAWLWVKVPLRTAHLLELRVAVGELLPP